MREYSGDFEVHLTVRAGDEATLSQFRRWCQQRSFKCVRIFLARGAQVEQPMATWRRPGTILPEVLEEAERWAVEITRLGIPVVRLKIEAAPHNVEIPIHDSDAAAHAPGNYFEHHVKLLRETTASQESLLKICENHGAHLSRNAFRQASAGYEQRFVTVRSYGVGKATSERQLQKLLAALNKLGEKIVQQESEYCVYDSNLALDAGWLPTPV